jgi:hypothetical protein
VRVALARLRKSAAGPDGIPSVFFKSLAYWLAVPLCIVYQQSLHYRCIPDEWRLAKVIALYKGKGDRSLPASYRPISLTSVACKVMERLVVDQLRKHLSDNNLICTQQHGFVPNRSTSTNLLQCDYVISQYLNRKLPCDLLTLDFSRAFDKVSHAILSHKLQAVGVQGQLHEWLLDFLAHRTQTVEYKGILSAPAPVTSGVVQGSVLGPLLFVIFVNDLPNCISTHSWLYADDLKLVGPASTPAECSRTQCDLDNIEAWYNSNQLPLCLFKSQCMHMGPSNSKHVYTLGGSAVPIVQQLTDLGLIRTSDCSSDAHVRGIIGRASGTMGLMWRVFSSRKLTFLMRLFKTYIRPVMEYASSSWNTSRPGLVRELEAIQRRFTKRLRGLGSHTYEARLQHLSLQSLEARRLQADLLMVHKVLTGQIDVTPASVGITVSTNSTRGAGINLVVSRAANSTTAQTFSLRVPSMYNRLPSNVKTLKTLSTFRRHVQRQLTVRGNPPCDSHFVYSCMNVCVSLLCFNNMCT